MHNGNHENVARTDDSTFLGTMNILQRKTTREKFYKHLYSDTPVIMVLPNSDPSLTTTGVLNEVYEMDSKARGERFYIVCTIFGHDGIPQHEEGMFEEYEYFELYV